MTTNRIHFVIMAMLCCLAASGAQALETVNDKPCLQTPIKEPATKAYCAGLHFNERGNMVIAGKKGFENAVDQFNEALRLKPGWGHAYAGRGVAYYNLNQFDKAKDDLDKAIALMPDDPWSFVARAAALNSLGHPDLAEKDFASAIALKPDLLAIYVDRAAIRSSHGDQAGAIEDYTKILDMVPATDSLGSMATRLNAHYFRALHEFELKRYKETIGDCTAAVSITAGPHKLAFGAPSQIADALYLRGVAKQRSGDAAGATADFDAAKTGDAAVVDRFAKMKITP